MARDVFGFFKRSAKRRAVLANFQAYVDVEPHNMLLHAVVKRILEQWPALILFFTDMVHAEGLACADRILDSLTDPSVKLYFNFLDWILPKFNAINASFQSEKCVITTAHSRICSIYREILSAFLKSEYSGSIKLNDVDPTCPNAQLEIGSVYIGTNALLAVEQ